MTDITELAQREKFEAWFKSSFHPDKTGPYIKDQLYFAWKAAGAELVEALEKARQRITQMESRTVTVKLPNQTQFDDPLSAYEAIEKCKEALTAEGIKWEAE
ncbi:TPA: hypothetical protein PCI26_002154 [Klebsiella pneumoniae]|uniref:hypothetical protein n=1 Tax=Klebsiella pneumoniae TaxID=573 RepID=UPI00330A79AD|nr:hypothetical protein [Klebsiella pneumoniae]HDE1287439.1 hypothetical protein [Klebsiella pneumoniae]HDG7424142.1 hypothetical protein [Klebsiella pneumoniae]HDG7468242.1 hypothetical protein [Klebsiella pneumoniae]HDG7479331.1 hypothetical protein [Klebsiella pneumoniae]